MKTRQIQVFILLCVWLLTTAGQLGYALTTISSNTTWTPSSIPTPGVTWNSGSQQFELTDSLTISANRTLTVQNGNNGGSFLLTLPNGGSLIVNSGAVIHLSGVSGNGNGGNFTVNLAGATGTINISGTVRSNGIGSGQGGTVTLNGSTYTLAGSGVIEATGGPSSGLGGVINLNTTGTNTFSLPNGFSLKTDGLTSATQNLITIQADTMAIDGQINANGTGNSAGGTIMLIADNGQIRIIDNGDLYARGAGSGIGGTLDWRAHSGAQALTLETCNGGTCNSGGNLIKVDRDAAIDISGGGSTNTGTLKIGRAGSGSIDQDMNQLSTNGFNITGAGAVHFGNDGGNTTTTTLQRYTQSSDFNGTNPEIYLYATTGGITATTNNNFDKVRAQATTGTINITDSAGGMTVNSLAGSGTSNLIANSGGSLTLQNAAATGAVNLTTTGAGAITATNSNDFTTVSVSSGSGAVNLTDNTGGMTIGSLSGSGAQTLTASGGGAITLQNASSSGTLTIQTDGSITGTVGNIISGIININGDGGAADRAGNVTLTNSGPTNFNGLTATNVNLTSTGATPSITLGSSGSPVDISGTTTFNAGTGDLIGTGSFTGAVSGAAGRIGLEVTSGNFTSGGITASSGSGWNGTANETLVIQTQNGDILGSGFTTSGAGNMRLQAGTASSLNASNNITVTNVSAAQNLGLYATGDSSGTGAGTAISLSGTSSVGGHITATGLNGSNQFTATTGGINLALSSGNLNTALVWSNSGTINLTANNGSILQDTSVYGASSTGIVGGKTIWGTGAINLTAQGGASRYIDTGVMALTASGTGGNITARASGDSAGNGTGVSINLRGRADGTMTVTNLAGGNTTGDVYLGTSIGASDTDLDDSPTTVMDVMGSTTVKANGDVRLYGSFWGPVSVTGRTVVGTVDKGSLNFTNVTTTATSGTGINLTALMGSLTGGNLSTAGTANIYLQAGSQFPRDKMAHITLSSVTTGGNLAAVAAGSSNGTTSGNAITITGSTGGSSSAQNESGGAPRGNVSMP